MKVPVTVINGTCATPTKDDLTANTNRTQLAIFQMLPFFHVLENQPYYNRQIFSLVVSRQQNRIFVFTFHLVFVVYLRHQRRFNIDNEE